MKIAVLESYSATSLARLTAAGHEHTADARDAEIALIRSRTQIDARFLDAHPKVKLVVTATSGFDHVDWRETSKRGVVACHTPEANAQSTAELTFALLLAFERDVVAAHKNVKTAKWRDGLPRPAGLDGHTLGIIGLGRVGSRVARMAPAFGLKLIAYDPYVDESRFAETGATRKGLIETLRLADYVTLHVPLTKETKHLLNNPTFAEMSPDAVLLNTCRGPVVDESALLSALDDRVIRGAAVDVIEREPPAKGNRLLIHPRLLLTPHVGAFTTSAWEKASHEAVSKALAWIDGGDPGDTLPLRVPWFEKT